MSDLVAFEAWFNQGVELGVLKESYRYGMQSRWADAPKHPGADLHEYLTLIFNNEEQNLILGHLQRVHH